MEQGNLFKEDFNEKYLGAYQQGLSDPTNKNHQFDSDTVTNVAGKTTPVAELAASVTTPTTTFDASEVMAFGHPVIDFANALMPNGAPVGSRHASALKLAQDLLIICDGNQEAVRGLLLQLQWVKDVVAERGMKELDDIMEAAKKLMHKRESENLNALMPSRNMRRAIEQVAGRKYSQLVRDAQKQLVTAFGDEDKDQTVALLERIGREVKKLLPHYPLLVSLLAGTRSPVPPEQPCSTHRPHGQWQAHRRGPLQHPHGTREDGRQGAGGCLEQLEHRARAEERLEQEQGTASAGYLSLPAS